MDGAVWRPGRCWVPPLALWSVACCVCGESFTLGRSGGYSPRGRCVGYSAAACVGGADDTPKPTTDARRVPRTAVGAVGEEGADSDLHLRTGSHVRLDDSR